MGTETLNTLFSIAIWGGLIFVMMRYGCGAHMMGGHGKHGRHGHGAPLAEGGALRTVCSRFVATAMASTSRVDVLVARIAPGHAIASSFAKISCMTSIFSNTASMTRSASFVFLRVVLMTDGYYRYLKRSGVARTAR